MPNALIKKHMTVYGEAFRYGVTGLVCFGVDFLSLIVGTEIFHIYYLFSTAIAFVVGFIVNYVLSVKWVFLQRKLSNKNQERSVFLVIALVGLGLTEFCMWFFTDIVGVYYIYSKLLTTGTVFIWNFGAKKKILF